MLLIMYISALFLQLNLFWEPPFWHPHFICEVYPLTEACRCLWDLVMLNWTCSLVKVFQKGVVSIAQAGGYAGNGNWAGESAGSKHFGKHVQGFVNTLQLVQWKHFQIPLGAHARAKNRYKFPHVRELKIASNNRLRNIWSRPYLPTSPKDKQKTPSGPLAEFHHSDTLAGCTNEWIPCEIF